MIKVTIDTCLINATQQLAEINLLEELNRKGLIEIVATDRLIQETQNHTKRSEKAESYKQIGEPFVVGYSRIGSAYISDGKKRPSFTDISAILFPEIEKNNLSKNQANDVMHLIAHLHSDSDYFVTNNSKDFIDAKRNNTNRGGSYKNVKTPSELIEELENKHKITVK